MKDGAMKSLHGRGHWNKVRTRECVAMPGLREQSIETPDHVWERLRRLWGEEPWDPCPIGGTGGLDQDWPERTYCNPPYGTLKAWLAHGAQFDEVIWLVPMRPHRVWFRNWWVHLDVRIALNPLKFKGYKDPYPAPLMLGYRGVYTAQFVSVFKDLGGLF